MAVWLDTTPVDGAANLIYSNIQAVKGEIIARLRCTNASAVDEHAFYGSVSSTGRHAISSVGFVKIHADVGALSTFITTAKPPNGSLHYVSGGLYIVDAETPIAISVIDHGKLFELDGADHPQYIDTLGVRLITGDMNIASPLVGITGAVVAASGLGATVGLSNVHQHVLTPAFMDAASISLENLAYTETVKSSLTNELTITYADTDFLSFPIMQYSPTAGGLLIWDNYISFYSDVSNSLGKLFIHVGPQSLHMGSLTCTTIRLDL